MVNTVKQPAIYYYIPWKDYKERCS